MAETWAKRQRSTNKLIRAIAAYVLDRESVLPEQLHGICMLTWITDGKDGTGLAYINSTKIPGLSKAFGRDFNGLSLEEVAEEVASIVEAPALSGLITAPTGFTNFYKPFRKSSEQWISNHLKVIRKVFHDALHLQSDEEGLRLSKLIGELPGIPKQNHPNNMMRPQFLLTPLCFALDCRLRFPIINGDQGVRRLLSAMKVQGATLQAQYSSMVSLYGKSGIKDAADLDQVGRGKDLPDFVSLPGKLPTKKLLGKKPLEGKQLSLKDEEDILSLWAARTVINKRLHNRITNELMESLADFTLVEGASRDVMFDLLVKNYDSQGRDLLVEVKSSIEPAHVRMAVGQLLHYWFYLNEASEPHIALVFPARPGEQTTKFLEWQNIGILWFEQRHLKTSTAWLKHLATH